MPYLQPIQPRAFMRGNFVRRRMMGRNYAHIQLGRALRGFFGDDSVDLTNLPLAPVTVGDTTLLNPQNQADYYWGESMLTPTDTVPFGKNYAPQYTQPTNPAQAATAAVNSLLSTGATTGPQIAAAPSISTNMLLWGVGGIAAIALLAGMQKGRR